MSGTVLGSTLNVGDLVDANLSGIGYRLCSVTFKKDQALLLEYFVGGTLVEAVCRTSDFFYPTLSKVIRDEAATRTLTRAREMEPANLQGRVRQLESQLAESQKLNEEMKSKAVHAQNAANAIHQRVAPLEAQLAASTPTLSEYRSQSKSQQQEIDDLQSQLQSTELLLRSSDQSKFSAFVELADVQQRMTLMDQERSQLRAAIERQANALGQRAASLANRIAELEVKLSEEKVKAEALWQSKAAAYAQLALVQQRATDKSRLADSLQQALAAVTQQPLRVKQLESQAEETTSQLHSVQAQMEEMLMRVDEISSEKSSSSSSSSTTPAALAPRRQLMRRSSPPRATARSASSIFFSRVPIASVSTAAAAPAIRSVSSIGAQTNLCFSSALSTSVPFKINPRVDPLRSLRGTKGAVGSKGSLGLAGSVRASLPSTSASAKALSICDSNSRLLQSLGPKACGVGISLVSHDSTAARRTCWSPLAGPGALPSEQSGDSSALSVASSLVRSWLSQCPSPEPVEGSLEHLKVRLPSLIVTRRTAASDDASREIDSRLSSDDVCSDADVAPRIVRIHFDEDDSSTDDEETEELKPRPECKADLHSSSIPQPSTRPTVPAPLSLEQLAAEFEIELKTIRVNESQSRRSSNPFDSDSDSSNDSDDETDSESESESKVHVESTSLIETHAGLTLRDWYLRMRERKAAEAAVAVNADSNIIERGELDERQWPKLGSDAQKATGEQDEEVTEDDIEEQVVDDCEADRVASAEEVEAAHIEPVDEEEEDDPRYEDEPFDESAAEDAAATFITAAASSVLSSASASPRHSSVPVPRLSSLSQWATRHAQMQMQSQSQWQSMSSFNDECLPASVIAKAASALVREEEEAREKMQQEQQKQENRQSPPPPQPMHSTPVLASVIIEEDSSAASTPPSAPSASASVSSSPHSATSSGGWQML